MTDKGEIFEKITKKNINREYESVNIMNTNRGEIWQPDIKF